MANSVVKVPIPDAPTLTVTTTGATAENTAYKMEVPSDSSNPVTITAPNGQQFKWQPTELAYRDSSGQMDYIVGSSPTSLSVLSRQARYLRTFPSADDWFNTDGNKVKHWTVLNEPPRTPASYLGAGIEFGVSGIVSGIPLPTGSHKTIDADPFFFPEPIIKDFAGNEIRGRYEVTDTTEGQQLFIWFDADYLNTATYPVMIDPTTVVSAAYDTSGNGGRKLVRTTSGDLYCSLKNTNYLYLYKSTDNGTTWTQVSSINANGGLPNTSATGDSANEEPSSWALAVDSLNNLHTVFTVDITNGSGIVEGRVYYVKGTDLTAVTVIYDAGGSYVQKDISIAIDGNDAIHLAWSGKTSTYPNSFNIRYSKSTDGGATWASPTQLTSVNISGVDFKNPSISINGSGNPIIVNDWHNGTSAYEIHARYFDGSAWSLTKVVYNGNSYAQYNPCAAVDSNGVIHVVWYGFDSTDNAVSNIRYSKSSDGGATWSSMIKLTSGNSYPQGSPSIVVDKNNKLYVFFQGRDPNISTSYDQIRKVIHDGTWGSVMTLTNNTTNHARYPASLWSKFNMNSDDAVRWIWQDMQASAVQYDSITLNTAPNAPTLGTRTNFDATESADFTWTFSDPDSGDSQSAYQLLIKRSSDGVIVVDTGKVASTTAKHTLAGATLTNNVQYQWQVRTWDKSDAVSPYSNLASFYTSAKPTVSITDPATDGTTVSTSSLTVQWSFSDPESEGQSAYQVKLTDSADVILWDSGKTSSISARSKTIEYTLANTTDYKVKVMVWDAKDVKSVEVVRTFKTSFTPPAKPTVTITDQSTYGYLNIAVSNPAPAVGEPNVTSNDIYRRKQGETAWVRIVRGIPANGYYRDYAAASDVTYEYKARAVGDNDITTDSEYAAGNITLTGVWLHDIQDAEGTAHHFKYDGQRRRSTWQAEVSMRQFAGRKRPVAEFGEMDEGKINVQVEMVQEDSDYAKLESLVQRKGTVCYRDGRGRKMFGIIKALPITDDKIGYTTSIEVTETAFSEVV
jgi:hypothetical protein